MFFRRFLPFLIIACLSSIFLVSVFYDLSWKQGLQLAGIGGHHGPTEEQLRTGHGILPDSRTHEEATDLKEFHELTVNSTSPYPIGKTKPAGSNYSKALVIPKLKSEDTSWIESELGDMIDSGLLKTAVYTVNDRKAKLHPPKNKGHEVMVYLSYIIDFYDDLPDVSIFMHAHRFAWHNMQLLDTDAAKMVRYLSGERVTREGYMNLRCQWDPGCPEWLHPGNSVKNDDKPEEIILAHSWSELFPIDPIPKVLAQPCCGQFAVSRERIRETNRMRYIFMRDWIIRTDLTDYISGRVFEYVWQFIFSQAPIRCPSESACTCDGYGICFGDAKRYEDYFEMMYTLNELKEDLRIWSEKADAVEKAKDNNGGWLKDTAQVSVPEPGKDKVLKRRIEELESMMQGLWQEAFNRGKDPRQRAVESGREWREGDGF